VKIGGGVKIAIFNNCTTVKWNIEININLSGSVGGLSVFFIGNGTTTAPAHYLRISNCVFQSGLSSTGGGASVVAAFIADHFDDAVNKTHEWMSILHSHFIGNTGLYGGGLAITILYLPSSNQPIHSNAIVTYTILPGQDKLCSLPYPCSTPFNFFCPKQFLHFLNSHTERFGSAITTCCQ